MTIAFGPVPSRRLGRSLGINNIPPKFCSYSCQYCQVGITHGKIVEPRVFYTPEAIYQAVSTQLQSAQLQSARHGDSPIDYLTFVPDGEPTLDSMLGQAIERLRPLNIPIAVISNASLLWRSEVRAALAQADWVSLKVDSVAEAVWRQINRPHASLQLNAVLDGIRRFARQFRGELVSETMLVRGINDHPQALAGVADFLQQLGVARAYLAIPTRPPAEPGVRGPGEQAVNQAYQILAERLPRVEYLIGYEGDAFAFSGDVRQDLLSITAVHPMRASAVRALLSRAGADWSVVEALMAGHRLRQVDYLGEAYYVRAFTPAHGPDGD